MKHSIKALFLGLLSLAFTGAAFAGSDTETFDITINIEAGCDLSTSALNPYHTIDDLSTGIASGGYFSIICNNQLPYTVEVDSNDGQVILTGATTGGMIEGTLHRGNWTDGPLWGQGADAIPGVGTGVWEHIQIAYWFDWDAVPEVDVYSRTNTVTAYF